MRKKILGILMACLILMIGLFSTITCSSETYKTEETDSIQEDCFLLFIMYEWRPDEYKDCRVYLEYDNDRDTYIVEASWKFSFINLYWYIERDIHKHTLVYYEVNKLGEDGVQEYIMVDEPMIIRIPL